MCDVCSFEGIDSEKLNGYKSRYKKICKIHGAKSQNVNNITLCYFHDIELFKNGEKRFFQIHPKLLRRVGVSQEEAVGFF